MEHREALDLARPTLLEIPADVTSYPDIPVNRYATDCLAVRNNLAEDAPAFLGINFPVEQTLLDLDIAIGALLQSEIDWTNSVLETEEAQQVWDDNNEEGYDARDEAIDFCDYIFEMQGDATGMQLMDDIRKGNGHSDMLMDLGKVHDVTERIAPALDAINFGTDKRYRLKELFIILSDAYGKVHADRHESSEERLLRDRAYYHLREIIRRIKRAAKLVFRNDRAKIDRYVSFYNKDKRARLAQSNSETGAE